MTHACFGIARCLTGNFYGEMSLQKSVLFNQAPTQLRVELLQDFNADSELLARVADAHGLTQLFVSEVQTGSEPGVGEVLVRVFHGVNNRKKLSIEILRGKAETAAVIGIDQDGDIVTFRFFYRLLDSIGTVIVGGDRQRPAAALNCQAKPGTRA